MNCRHAIFWLLLTAACPALAEDMPLPVQGPLPDWRGDGAPLTPSVIIRPPGSGPIVVPAAKPPDTREQAILEMESRLIEEHARREIAGSQQSGQTIALKQLILMGGPVDAAVGRAPKPPGAAEGKVALIGLPPSQSVSQHVEHFFGAPMTPDRERQLLETVKAQLGTGKDKPQMDVRIAGWWPAQGVMALSVVPKG